MRRYSDAPSLEAQRVYRQPKRLGRYRYVRLRWRILFAIIDFFGGLLVAGYRRVACHPMSRIPRNPRAILLVQLDHLGDAVISTVLPSELRRRFPRASIEVLAGSRNCELFRACPEVDRVHVARVNRFGWGGFGLWMLSVVWWGLALRRRRFDWAIDVRGEFPSALILWLCGAPRRAGWNCGGGGFLLTDSPRFEAGRPEVESRWALLSAMGVTRTDPSQRSGPAFDPGPLARSQVERWLEPLRDHTGSLFVLHVGAGTPAKRWPVGNWRELCGRLLIEYGAQIVLVGDRRDARTARQVIDGLPQEDLHDWTGRLEITQLAALLQQADLVIGADSGPAHLAAAVGARVIVLFSGTNDAQQWQPWGERVTVIRHGVACSPCHRVRCPWLDHPCMNQLLPETVMRAVDRTLKRNESRQGLPLSVLNRRAGQANERANQPSRHSEIAGRLP